MSDTHNTGGSYIIGADGQRTCVEPPTMLEVPSEQISTTEVEAVVPPTSDEPDKAVAKKRTKE